MRTAEGEAEGGGVPSLASMEQGRNATRVRPKTAGATPTSRGRKGWGGVLEDLPDRQELEVRPIRETLIRTYGPCFCLYRECSRLWCVKHIGTPEYNV